MSWVVDSNVVAYYLLRTEPFADVVRRFWRDAGHVAAPASWEAEIVNVLWRAVRAGILDPDEAVGRLDLVRALGIRSVPVQDLWAGALALAVAARHPPYDTLFVELGRRLRVPLATFDGTLLRRFPDIARRPGRPTGR